MLRLVIIMGLFPRRLGHLTESPVPVASATSAMQKTDEAERAYHEQGGEKGCDRQLAVA